MSNKANRAIYIPKYFLLPVTAMAPAVNARWLHLPLYLTPHRESSSSFSLPFSPSCDFRE